MSQSSFGHLFSLIGARRDPRRRARSKSPRWVPSLDVLEDRLALSTVSAINANFNGTPIPAGDSVWFNSALTVSGLGSAPVTLHVVNGSIDFAAGGKSYHLAVPNAEIVFTPGATSASTTFDPADSDWDTSVPSKGTGDVFLSGVALPVPNGLPGGIKSVSWSASFWSDTAGITVNWKWAAAVYKNFSTDYNALGVKPVDSKNLSLYGNADQSGTPEAFASAVTAGATGGGGKNYTGNYSPGESVKPSFGDGVSDYPFASSNPLTSVAFNESEVLRAANLDVANGAFEVWYNDEHALALGVRQVSVKTASGTTTTNYPVTALTSNPGVALNAAVGTTATTGDQAGTDLSGRPMSPSLYITDVTSNPNNRSGDWQYGGTGIAPSAVFGTWKAFVRTVDYTTSTPTVRVTADADPAQNNWNLGAGADAPPAGLKNEGYGAEMRWNLNDLYNRGVLIPGHTYRFYVMVHDGDQNKVGGDAGQASFTYYYPGPGTNPGTQPASLSGHVYADDNLDGVMDGLAGVVLVLTGTDSQGRAVSMTATTDSNGSYSFTGLLAGTYQVSQPSVPGYMDGVSYVGTVNDISDGEVEVDYSLGNIVLRDGDQAINYDYTKIRPLS